MIRSIRSDLRTSRPVAKYWAPIMKIRYMQPVDRGVTTLMYVGDDAVAAPTPAQLGIGVVAAIVALQSKGITRLAAIGVAALIGYRAYRVR